MPDIASRAIGRFVCESCPSRTEHVVCDGDIIGKDPQSQICVGGIAARYEARLRLKDAKVCVEDISSRTKMIGLNTQLVAERNLIQGDILSIDDDFWSISIR